MVELLGIFGFLVVLLRAAILCFQTVAIGGILFLTRRGAKAGAAKRGTAALELETDPSERVGAGLCAIIFRHNKFPGADVFDRHSPQRRA